MNIEKWDGELPSRRTGGRTYQPTPFDEQIKQGGNFVIWLAMDDDVKGIHRQLRRSGTRFEKSIKICHITDPDIGLVVGVSQKISRKSSPTSKSNSVITNDMMQRYMDGMAITFSETEIVGGGDIIQVPFTEIDSSRVRLILNDLVSKKGSVFVDVHKSLSLKKVKDMVYRAARFHGQSVSIEQLDSRSFKFKVREINRRK